MRSSRLFFVCAIYLFALAEFKDSIIDNEVIINKKTSQHKDTVRTPLDEFRELPMYIGYSHDPFGPSKLYINKNISDILDFAHVPTEVAGNVSSGRRVRRPKKAHGTEQRSKRGVFHLYNMVYCATGCNPLTYKGYGCFCGFLGSGRAVDGIDRCCKLHDWCYETTSCPLFFTYLMPYFWKCYDGQPLCALNNYEFANVCAQRLCECDRLFSKCLARYPCPQFRATCPSSRWRILQNAFRLFK